MLSGRTISRSGPDSDDDDSRVNRRGTSALPEHQWSGIPVTREDLFTQTDRGRTLAAYSKTVPNFRAEFAADRNGKYTSIEISNGSNRVSFNVSMFQTDWMDAFIEDWLPAYPGQPIREPAGSTRLLVSPYRPRTLAAVERCAYSLTNNPQLIDMLIDRHAIDRNIEDSGNPVSTYYHKTRLSWIELAYVDHGNATRKELPRYYDWEFWLIEMDNNLRKTEMGDLFLYRALEAIDMATTPDKVTIWI
jgi:hypothetical protein